VFGATELSGFRRAKNSLTRRAASAVPRHAGVGVQRDADRIASSLRAQRSNPGMMPRDAADDVRNASRRRPSSASGLLRCARNDGREALAHFNRRIPAKKNPGDLRLPGLRSENLSLSRQISG